MRYLKPYKIFEATEVDFDIEQDIKDIFLELEDIGFTIKIGNRRFSGGYEIEIMKINDDSQKEDFLLREICDSLIVLVSYLKDSGYYIYDVLGKGKNEMGREGNKNISWVSNLDPKIDFQQLGPHSLFDTSLTYVEIIIRKK